VLVGGDGSRKNRLEAVDRIFKRSFNPWANPPTPSAGTGMARVRQTQPVPVPQANPRHLPAGFSYP